MLFAPKKRNIWNIKKELIKEGDYCFIAVNTALLGPYANVGISGLPSIVEATLATGPRTITVDKESGKHLSSSLQYRPEVKKKNNELISLKILDGRQKDYQWLDGIIGGHVHPYAPPELRKLVAVLNNTEKAKSLKGILPVKSCYFASWLDEESYSITEWMK